MLIAEYKQKTLGHPLNETRHNLFFLTCSTYSHQNALPDGFHPGQRVGHSARGRISTLKRTSVFCSKYFNASTFDPAILLGRTHPVAKLECVDTDVGMNQEGYAGIDYDGVEIGNSPRLSLNGRLAKEVPTLPYYGS